MSSNIQSIITIRNRDPIRILNLVKSLRNKKAITEYILVDYGSNQNYAKSYESLAYDENITLLRMETQGLPWNKCHAINAGFRVSTAPWIATIDVDMFFDCDPFPYCLKNNPEKKIQVMQTWWLPKSGNIKNAVFGSKGHPGPFNFQSRQAFIEAGGYDERIQYWGLEDWDWPRRLEKIGYDLEWLPEEYKFYHVWHPTSNNPLLRPTSSAFETAAYYFENQISPVLNQDWGKLITQEQRPVLKYINDSSLPVLEIRESDWVNCFSEIKSFVQVNQVGKICWGPRRKNRKLDQLRWMKPFFEKIVTSFGWVLVDQVNSNFDTWYATKSTMNQLGVTDWYLSEELDYLIVYRG